MGVFDELGDKAKELADKAKHLATDEQIDSVAEKVKGLTPDSIDGKIDAASEKLKDLND